jgi:hypothetical protein
MAANNNTAAAASASASAAASCIAHSVQYALIQLHQA